MKVTIVMGIALFLAGCVNGPAKPSDQIVNTYSVTEFMGRLDDAITPAAVAARDNGLLLTGVKLTFNVVLTEKESGEIKILFIKVGGSNTTARTTEYTVTLGAPEDLAEGFGKVSVDDKYLKNFAAALEGLVADSSKYSVGELVTHKVTASLKYYIQDNSTGGLDHEFEVIPVSLKVGTAVSEAATQTILLTFEAPKKEEE